MCSRAPTVSRFSFSLVYDLSRDRDKFPPSHFLAPVDAFDTAPDNVMVRLDAKCAIIHPNAAFHLFNYADQVLLTKQIMRLFQLTSGSPILFLSIEISTPPLFPLHGMFLF